LTQVKTRFLKDEPPRRSRPVDGRTRMNNYEEGLADTDARSRSELQIDNVRNRAAFSSRRCG
jgi:hypothetical protein